MRPEKGKEFHLTTDDPLLLRHHLFFQTKSREGEDPIRILYPGHKIAVFYRREGGATVVWVFLSVSLMFFLLLKKKKSLVF